jgi:nucleoside-diphosphate-sugar epimerase
MNFKIGITGKSGVIGEALCKAWNGPDFSAFEGDIQDYDEVKNWFAESGPFDAIIHLAALVPTNLVDAEPLKAFKINVLGTCNILEICRTITQKKSPWIFIASSSHVYASTNTTTSISETAPMDPINTYGLTKAQADRWAEIYRTKYNLPVCIGRFFSFSAPDQQASYFIPSMISRIKNAPKDSKLEVRGLDGTRDFLTTKQITKAVQFLCDKKATGAFNIGTGTSIKLLKLAEALKNRLGREDVTILSTGSDTHHLCANSSKLKELGLTLEFDLNLFLDSILV